MKKMQLQFWHPIVGLVLTKILEVLNENFMFRTQGWASIYDLIILLREILLVLLLYIIIRNIVRTIKRLIAHRSSSRDKELERQREVERKEIDMVRKSNEILLHLIQDEHREEGDR